MCIQQSCKRRLHEDIRKLQAASSLARGAFQGLWYPGSPGLSCDPQLPPINPNPRPLSKASSFPCPSPMLAIISISREKCGEGGKGGLRDRVGVTEKNPLPAVRPWETWHGRGQSGKTKPVAPGALMLHSGSCMEDSRPGPQQR